MDYIRRLLQQVTEMLAAIIGSRQAGKDAEAAQQIDKACLQTAGLPIDLIRQSLPEALRSFLQSGGPQRMARDILLAELLLQDGELSESAGRREESLRCKSHAFCLIVDSVDALAGDDAAHYRGKLNDLAEQLAAAPHDPYVAEKLRGWRERPVPKASFSGAAPTV